MILASWSPRLHFNASLFQIEDDDILSLYDVLQESINIESIHKDWITYWTKECNYTLKFIENTNDIKIYEKISIECMSILVIVITNIWIT